MDGRGSPVWKEESQNAAEEGTENYAKGIEIPCLRLPKCSHKQNSNDERCPAGPGGKRYYNDVEFSRGGGMAMKIAQHSRVN